ncbi:mannosyltransferase [Coemansia sp. RSA 2131]|nr:mannosyltransferase [Coemansia sp. RSA 2131]
MARQRHNAKHERPKPSVKHERVERREQKLQLKARKHAESEASHVQQVEELDTQHAEYVPSLSVLFRFLALVRVSGALLSPIQDCDEVYNYWEPLHFLQFGTGKQTWEYSPQYSLRSYAYLHIYDMLIRTMHIVFGFRTKTQVFYALRVCLALMSALCEAVLVRSVAQNVDRRMANYVWLAVFGMAGMFHAAPAVLPTSFAMCLCTLGSAAAMVPPVADMRRHLKYRVVPATVAFALAVCAGWPYAALVAVPFVLEEMIVKGSGTGGKNWRARRLCALVGVGASAAFVIVGAMAVVDSWYYGRPVVAAWNQVAYNVLGQHDGSSELYGTEPWYFYLKNGLLNANIVMILALSALPMWILYYVALKQTSRTTLSIAGSRAIQQLFSGHHLLLFRIMPFYLVLLVFSLQPHKEERFLSIAYPHLCFCAAAALSLASPLQSWACVLLGRRTRAGQSRAGYLVLAGAACMGALRMTALVKYYGAPVRAFMELPSSNVTGLLPLGPSIKSLRTVQPLYGNVDDRVVCMGGAWYWYPSSYWLPRGYTLQFVRELGNMDGHLPGDFVPVKVSGSVRSSTSAERPDFNARNEWEPLHATELSECDYVVGIEYPQRGEPKLAHSEWQRVGECHSVLDPVHSSVLARMVYVPQTLVWMTGQRQEWGQMCVYERANRLIK